MNTNGATMCPIRSTKRRMTCDRPNQEAVAHHRINKTSSMAMICQIRPIDVEGHDVNSHIVRANGQCDRSDGDEVLPLRYLGRCRRCTQSHELHDSEDQRSNLTLRAAALLASCHRAGGRRPQRCRLHETSAVAAPQRSGRVHLRLGDHSVFPPLVFCGVHGFADAISKGEQNIAGE